MLEREREREGERERERERGRGREREGVWKGREKYMQCAQAMPCQWEEIHSDMVKRPQAYKCNRQ